MGCLQTHDGYVSALLRVHRLPTTENLTAYFLEGLTPVHLSAVGQPVACKRAHPLSVANILFPELKLSSTCNSQNGTTIAFVRKHILPHISYTAQSWA